MSHIQSKLQKLFDAVKDVDHLLIVPHNNPDPDAIACAVALRYLLEQKRGMTTTIAYKGIIGRAENRALVRYLGYPLQRLTAAHLSRASAIALVDTQVGSGNHPIPDSRMVTIVIDHHPWNTTSSTVPFCDVQPELGAATTILVEYLRAAELTFPPTLATALFYGIKTDTLGLMRNATPTDRDAFCHLLSQVDLEAVSKLDHAPLSPDYFKSLAAILHAARIYNNVIIAYVALMPYPDLTADMADFLLRRQDCQWVVCLGIYQETVILSVRTRQKHGAGQLVRTIVGDQGTAGGHGSVAGGQMPLNGKEPHQLIDHLSQLFVNALSLTPEQNGQPLI